VPAHGLPRGLRHPSRRALALAAGVLAATALVYVAARETSLFAVREIEVEGAPRPVQEAVRDEAGTLLGESLVALDRDELRRRLEELPMVRSLSLDRAFPHTLRIAVEAERPLAVVQRGEEAWLVSARGRVIGPADSAARAERPRISADEGDYLIPGELIGAGRLRVALDALGRIPAGFPVEVRWAHVEDEEVTFGLGDGTHLLLGPAEALRLKLVVAGRVLRAMIPDELAELGYLDVTVPERPVAAPKSQVSS
jgi:cell division protein FtsQ